MSKKTYDHKYEATFLANVLKHNKELVNDESRFDDLVVALEVRLMEAYNAGRGGAIEVESVFEAAGAPAAEILPPDVPGNLSN